MPSITIVVCGTHINSENESYGGYCSILVDEDETIRKLFNGSSITFAGPLPGAKPTHNRAELHAAAHAVANSILYLGERVAPGYDHVAILTSSEYLIEGIGAKNGGNGNIENWRANNWKRNGGKDVKNKDLWEKLYNFRVLGEQLGIIVEFHHIEDDDPRRREARAAAHRQAEAQVEAKRRAENGEGNPWTFPLNNRTLGTIRDVETTSAPNFRRSSNSFSGTKGQNRPRAFSLITPNARAF